MDDSTDGKKLLRSYPKIYSIEKDEVKDILEGLVEVTEKIDGSQFAFTWDEKGKFHARSKNKEIFLESCDKQFKPVMKWASSIVPLPGELVYVGETLSSARHNNIKYSRAPENNFVLFDVHPWYSSRPSYIPHCRIKEYADLLGCDCVQLYHCGQATESEIYIISDSKEYGSMLGGNEIEGVVIKRIGFLEYPMAKVVSDKYKEIAKEKIPTLSNQGDLNLLFDQYKTESRWRKAYQYLRDDAELDHTMRDVGSLMKRVYIDIEEECKEEIKEMIWQAFRKQLFKRCTYGLAGWYKDLMEAEDKE